MTLYTSLIPTNQVNSVWPHIRRYAQQVEAVSDGRTSLDTMYDDLVNNRKLLWVVFDSHDEETVFLAFAITSIRHYPGKRVLSVDYLGGEEMDKWIVSMSDTLSNFAANQDCTGLEAVGRFGWQRALTKLGWSPKFVICEKVFTVPEAIRKEMEAAVKH